MSSELSPDVVRSYLKLNPQFLESYVTSSAVSRDTFQRWTAKRTHTDSVKRKKQGSPSTSMNGASPPNTTKSPLEWTTINHNTKRKLLLEMSTDASDAATGNLNALLYELMGACIYVVNADGGHLYVFSKETQELYYYASDTSGGPPTILRPGSGSTVSAFVAKTHQTIRASDIDKDERFPDGTGRANANLQAVLCVPLMDTGGVLLGVMELYRLRGNAPFTDKDMDIACTLSLWGCHGIYFSQLFAGDQVLLSMLRLTTLFRNMNKQRKLNDFLLTVTKSIFHDIVSMDTVIMKVMNFAQKLVNADRASLFLVDNRSNELYARIFDVGTEGQEAGALNTSGHKEIRFPIGKGIAGHVAQTGQVLNIEDAYTDERFNRDVDLKTGYTTRTILCMPIYIRATIIGVVQMVNKQNGVFTRLDEEAFEAFAVYCGLALHHAKLYDRIRRSEQKYKVALEVLAYHSLCSSEEFNKMKKLPIPDRVPTLESYDVHSLKVPSDEKALCAIEMYKLLFTNTRSDMNALKLTEIEKPQFAISMFQNLFSLKDFDEDDLIRFVLTVRKNYRRVPYHNWTHGWSVAHAMFVILRHTHVFTRLESISMYIAALCHDLDHRGKNNAFMKSSGTPLASIYSTSVMEHHHFNQCVTILQQEGHNIFKGFSYEDYKWVLGNIKHCILATDLALFFPNKAKLKTILDEGSFSWEQKEHRLLVQSICMTGCDLIAAAKPWDVQTETVEVIFEEFYEQGDTERMNGREPIPMMDRSKAHELPQMQVGFMSGIVVPCYELLSQVIPCAEKLVERSKYNLQKWKELASVAKNPDD